jgi:hypothetical protein
MEYISCFFLMNILMIQISFYSGECYQTPTLAWLCEYVRWKKLTMLLDIFMLFFSITEI